MTRPRPARVTFMMRAGAAAWTVTAASSRTGATAAIRRGCSARSRPGGRSSPEDGVVLIMRTCGITMSACSPPSGATPLTTTSRGVPRHAESRLARGVGEAALEGCALHAGSWRGDPATGDDPLVPVGGLVGALVAGRPGQPVLVVGVRGQGAAVGRAGD